MWDTIEHTKGTTTTITHKTKRPKTKPKISKTRHQPASVGRERGADVVHLKPAGPSGTGGHQKDVLAKVDRAGRLHVEEPWMATRSKPKGQREQPAVW
jgi:hypothetical protein